MMENHDLVGIAVQVPIVALCFFFIGREINALAKKVDTQAEAYRQAMVESNQVQRTLAVAVTALTTLIENRGGFCPIHSEPMDDGEDTRRQRRRATDK